MKSQLYTVVFLFFASACLSQTYNITSNASGCSNCADVVFPTAFSSANAGGNVIVNLNAPSLLVNSISGYLTSGTLTIQKHSGATTEQGFTTSTYGALNLTCDSVVDITIRDISIKNASFWGIVITGGRKLLMENLTFTNTASAILVRSNYMYSSTSGLIYPATVSSAKSVTIQNSKFEYINPNNSVCSQYALHRRNELNTANPCTFKFLNNELIDMPVLFASSATTDNVKVEIRGNYLGTGAAHGIFRIGDLFNWCGGGYQCYQPYSHPNNDYLLDLLFENNVAGELALVYPLNYWKIQNNSFVHGWFYGDVYTTSGGIPRNFKLGLNNSSVPICNNQTFSNSNNVFPGTNPQNTYVVGNMRYSLECRNIPGDPCAISEFYDLDWGHKVYIEPGNVIRRCKILIDEFGTTVPPINGGSNVTATIHGTLVSGTNLMAYYTYTNIANSDNNHAYIDFYKSNAKGELIDYLGEQFIPSGSLTGNGIVTLPIPMGVSLGPSDRIALTITGIHPPSSSNVMPKGTSKAFYSQPPGPCCTTLPTLGIVTSNVSYCSNEMINFTINGSLCNPTTFFAFDNGQGQMFPLYSGSGSTISKNILQSFCKPGVYTVKVIDFLNACTVGTQQISITECNNNIIGDPDNIDLPNCQSGFKPTPGDYMLSFWVREDLSSMTGISSYASGVDVIIAAPSNTLNIPVYGNTNPNSQFRIIDGWQKVEAKITIPNNATDITVKLKNNTTASDVYFDDIRFQPFNSSLKSFVYDPVTLRLSAELDERNNATFYEYDEEGKLTRIKKETESGIKTIKESRSSAVK